MDFILGNFILYNFLLFSVKIRTKKFITADGSPTLYLEQWNEYYHSKHGAINEAVHVYIKAGLEYWHSNNNSSKKQSCNIFEMGFGTGLNAALTLEYAQKNKLHIFYNTLEAFPLSEEEIIDLNLKSFFDEQPYTSFLQKLYSSSWEEVHEIAPYFSILKNKKLLSNFLPNKRYDVIFYDAFGPRVQPELWTSEVLKPVVEALVPQGVFVTYSAKGSVRRVLQSFGLTVQKIPGPPGKREMLRAICF